MSDTRKPWEIPVIYNDYRWVEPTPAQARSAAIVASEEHRHIDDIEELLARPARREEKTYECNDTTPLNYSRGPHSEAFGVDENDGDPTPDPHALRYDFGPHNEEFGVDDNDDLDGPELDPADPDEDEFADEE